MLLFGVSGSHVTMAMAPVTMAMAPVTMVMAMCTNAYVCSHMLTCHHGCCSYEQERLPRVEQVIHARGHDLASFEDKERRIYKPTFQPLRRAELLTAMIYVAVGYLQVLPGSWVFG